MRIEYTLPTSELGHFRNGVAPINPSRKPRPTTSNRLVPRTRTTFQLSCPSSSSSRWRYILQFGRQVGKARFVVDCADLETAREMRLLRGDISVQSDNSSSQDYGLVYNRNNNIADDEFSSQKLARARCKDFAIKCGFQIFVKQTSVKANNSGNAKYQCKKLDGVQYFDQDTPSDQLKCPFFINVYGLNGVWKLTKATFSHNHAKGVGFTRAQCVEASVPRPATALRNTTQDVQEITRLVMTDLLPMHANSTASLDGKAIREFLKSRGFDISRSAISRMKLDIDDRLRGT